MAKETNPEQNVIILLAFVILEVLSQTYGFYWQMPTVASIFYLLSGLGIAILPMLQWSISLPNAQNDRAATLATGLFSLLVLWCLWRTSILLTANPLSYRQADMLPVIQTMAERMLSGAAIYSPINEIWEGMRPIYLPAMWLPFIPAVWWGVDIRWISALFLLFPAGLIFWCTGFKERGAARNKLRLRGLIPMVLLYVYIFGLYSTLLTLSEEPVVVSYYLLLAWSIFRKQPIFTGFALALCLLSRYSLAFWAPMYLVYLFFFISRRYALITLSALVISGTILMTIGRAWDQIGFFLQLQESYLDELLDSSKSWSFISQIEKNPGIVKFLPYEQIDLWHRLLVYTSALVPILCFFAFKRYRKLLDARFFGLCSLKLCLVVFFNLLTIPYSYLFYPSTFLSLFILFATFSAKSAMQRNYL